MYLVNSTPTHLLLKLIFEVFCFQKINKYFTCISYMKQSTSLVEKKRIILVNNFHLCMSISLSSNQHSRTYYQIPFQGILDVIIAKHGSIALSSILKY